MKNDIALKECWSYENIEKVIKTFGSSSQQEKYNTISYISATLSNGRYYDWCVKTIIKYTNQPKQKKKLESALRCFLPELISMGYDAHYVYSELRKCFFEKNVVDKNSVKKFLDVFNFEIHKYTVYFSVSALAIRFKDILVKYCCVPVTHKVTLGEIVDLLVQFKQQPVNLMMPKMPAGSFAKKLFSLYLSYLPADRFKYAMKMNCDDRGSFTELVHTQDCGQVSINISKPGITKGQHWHNSKWEQFIVVHGHGLIQERNINTGETVEFEVSGDRIEAIYMIPGWTHNIINLSHTEDLVTVMTCNEIFDPERPDTFFEIV